MEETLRPCPVCGATKGLYVLYDEHDMEWIVFCDSCKTSLRNEYNDTRDDAISTWNRRAERTCNVESSHVEREIVDYSYLEVELSCGHAFTWDDGTPPDYCPFCGARIIREETGDAD